MNPAPPAKPPARLAADLARTLTLSDPARSLLTPGLTPRQYFDALRTTPLPDDAIRFLAAALPKREAVWWGCVCLKEAPPVARIGPAPPPPADPAAKAVAAAERWVRDPSEPNRRAAGEAAELAGYGTPAGCLAVGAFWSGGSLAPPEVAPVPPRDDLTGIAVAGALLLATATDPARSAAAKDKFLAAGSDIAAGRGRWA